MMKKTLSVVALAGMMLCSSISIVGSGKPPSPDIALRVTISGTPNAPGAYSIVGDLGGDYVDGQEGVYAKFQIGNGSNDFIMDPTDRGATAPRALWFDFSDKIADGNIANPWYGLGLRKIDTYLNFNNVYTVQVGSVEERTGGFGQLFAGSGKKVNYAVKFNPDPSAPNYTIINTPNFTATVEVSHPDCNTWILTPKAVTYSDSGYGSGSGPVAALISAPNSTGQYLMPFQITLTRKTVISCP